VLEKAIAICKGRINKLVGNFTVNLPDELPLIFTDFLALEQVLVKLLINAVQAADKDNSWIKLIVTRGELEPESEQIIVEVSDNGSGMDTATQRWIFDPSPIPLHKKFWGSMPK
jgi:C4-dicarboxylate-specific signal transduction histidine kinase